MSDTLTLSQANYFAVGIVGSQGFKADWVKAFAGLDVYVAGDGDEAGRDFNRKVVKAFVDLGRPSPKIVPLPDGQDVTDVFTKQRDGAVTALKAAGFASANEGTLRVRLADAGKSIALSAEFPEDDGEVTAATRKTGQRQPLPEVPGLMDVVFGEYLLNAAALGFTALAGLVALLLWPWLRARRDA